MILRVPRFIVYGYSFSSPSDKGAGRSDVTHEEVAVLAKDARRNFVTEALLVVGRHAKRVPLLAFIDVHQGVARERAVHVIAAGAVLRLIVVQPEVINDCLTNYVLVLLVLSREVPDAVRIRPALVLATGTWRVHVARRVPIELICLMVRSLRGATGILNWCVREVRGDCLLRTDWSDILGQCLRLRGAHARRGSLTSARRRSQLKGDLLHVE